jgi:predicted nuclease with TOPRIM domain
VRRDLEQQAHESEHALEQARRELEEVRRDLKEQQGVVLDLKAERDAAARQLEEQKRQHDQLVLDERRRYDENLQRANQQIATMDGRLSSHRDLHAEATQALARSERLEESVSAELRRKVGELSAEHQEASVALRSAEGRIEQDLGARNHRLQNEMASEEVCMRWKREALEDEQHHLEARMSELQENHGRSQIQQDRVQDSLRSQLANLQDQLTESLQRGHTYQQEVEQLRQETERQRMNHKLELDRLQDLLDQRASSVSRLEQDLAGARQEIADHTLQAQSLAEQKANMATRISILETRLEQEAGATQGFKAAAQAAEEDVRRRVEAQRQLEETAKMAGEELCTRQVEWALEKGRLGGALEESRRTLRNSMCSPNPAAAVDTARMSDLERQLQEERAKSIKMSVEVQRAQRENSHLEEMRKMAEKQYNDAEQRCRHLSEGLCRAQTKQFSTEELQKEERERAGMAFEEVVTVRYDAKFAVANLRGKLDELRVLFRAQDATRSRNPYEGSVGTDLGLSGGYPSGVLGAGLSGARGFGGALGGEFGADIGRSFPGELPVRLGTGLLERR